jgi:glycosyltransferase involved in cell wall biosynthesis
VSEPGDGDNGKTVLFITQVYPPDAASVGQHLADAAAELVRRGNRVVVLTADRGYDDPSMRYPKHEVRDGVSILRLPWSSFGKGSMAVRLAGGVSFLAQAIVRAFLMRGLDRVVLTTVPPLSALAGAVLSLRRAVATTYWVMDLNPDQLVALGVVNRNALAIRLLDWANRVVLRRAAAVVVCDEYMAERIRAKHDPGARLHVVVPWAHDEVRSVEHSGNPFRARPGFVGKRVIMYSGNHALTNPLGTLLDASERVLDDDRLSFAFIGGGVGKRQVEARNGANIVSLPYQPMSELQYSLSAGDVHVATIGDGMVGIVHPCKVYGAMAAGRPLLTFGPEKSHLADLARSGIGWHVRTGDIDGAEAVLRSIAAMPEEELQAMGRRARALMDRQFNSASLRNRLCDIVEQSTPPGQAILTVGG